MLDFSDGVAATSEVGGTEPSPVTTCGRWPSAQSRVLGMGATFEVLPTGFASLDAVTRGGLRFGLIVTLLAPPDAGKSTVLKMLGWRYARAGYPVAALINDESPEDFLTRIGQEYGLAREALEHGDPESLKALATALDDLPYPLIVADCDEDGATVESIAEALSQSGNGRPGVLLIDSLQTVKAEGIERATTRKDRVETVLRAVRRVRSQHGHLIIATSEVPRGHYAKRAGNLSAGKDSGDIEFAAKLQLVLRAVPGADGEFEVSFGKNKIGKGTEPFRLHLDRDRATFSEEQKSSAPVQDDTRARILLATKAHDLKSANAVFGVVKGTRAVVIRLVGEMLATGDLVKDQSGFLRPAPVST